MSFAQVHWFSSVLGKQVGMYVLLPDVGKPPFSTLYLLHGLSDDYTIWHRRTRIESYLDGLPLIVVMPDGDRKFYTRNDQGPDYDKHLAEELPAFIERTFPAKRTRAGRCLGGLSMGGYGALRLALGHPDVYISAHSHSGALLAGTKRRHKNLQDAEFARIFGTNPERSHHDLFHLVKKAKKAGLLPEMRIDCGTEDFLLDENRTFHSQLNKLNIAHQYQEFPGSHNWDYWDRHLPQAIEFHAKAMKLRK